MKKILIFIASLAILTSCTSCKNNADNATVDERTDSNTVTVVVDTTVTPVVDTVIVVE